MALSAITAGAAGLASLFPALCSLIAMAAGVAALIFLGVPWTALKKILAGVPAVVRALPAL
jgi:hypothetical protein